MTLSIVVPGNPIGKQRPAFGKGHAYTPAKTRTYESFIKSLFVAKYGDAFTPLEGPLEMEILCIFAVPMSASKKRALDMLWQREWPTKRPDLSNILKAGEDALNGLAFRDDSQIVSLSVVKQYGKRAQMEIKIRPIGEEP